MSPMPRLYRWTLRILPSAVLREDGEEMAWAFDCLWSESRSLFPRMRLSLRAFGRLPWVAAKEGTEKMGLVPTPGSDPKKGRSGMSSWNSNLRQASRSLRKAPAFALTTVVLLGLGIGSVTTIFTLVDHVLLRPLPYPAAESLIVVENGSHPGPVFQEFQAMNSVESWGAAMSETANLVGQGDPLRITETRISRDFFALFGARPAHGRLLVEEDFDAANVVVLSHGSWETVFGADPGIVGRNIQVDGASLEVVGVLGRPGCGGSYGPRSQPG